MCEPGQEDLYTGDPTSQNGVEEEHHPVQEVRSSMFVSLFLSSNRLMQWIFLSESLQDFMGHGIRFEEAKTWLVAELLKAGWTAEALAIAETLQGKDAKDQIRGYAAIQLARKGEFDKAYKLMTNLEDAGSSYGYWQVTGHEVSDTRIAVQAIEFERLLISEDIAGAQRIALDLWANIQMQRKCYTHWSMYSQVKDW